MSFMFPSAKEKEALPRCLLPANRKLKVIDCVLNFESVRELIMTFFIRRRDELNNIWD